MGEKLPRMAIKAAVNTRVGGRLGDKRGGAKGLANTLDSVHPERFARPDFTKWAVFKSDPSIKPEAGTFVDVNEAAMIAQGGSSAPGPPSGGRGHSSEPSSAPPSPARATGPLIPPAVAQFLGKLPHVSEYNGPVIPVDEMIKIINGLPVTVPTGDIVWVPSDEYVVVPAGRGRYDRGWYEDRRRDDRRDGGRRDDRDRGYGGRDQGYGRERERGDGRRSYDRR